MNEFNFWLLMTSLWITNKSVITAWINFKTGPKVELVQLSVVLFCFYKLFTV